MNEQNSKLAKGIFLLAFTKELIKNSKNFEMYKLEQIMRNKFPTRESRLEEAKENLVEKISKKIQKPMLKIKKTFMEELKTPLPVKRPKYNEVFSLRPSKPVRLVRRPLSVPETRLPPHLRYLKPTISEEKISLGKLDPLVMDRNVKVIECEGAEQSVLVTGSMGKKPTGIVLKEEEIKKVISDFSNATKIPISEGVTKMVLGNLILTAIVSEEAGSQFVIKKLEMERGRRF